MKLNHILMVIICVILVITTIFAFVTHQQSLNITDGLSELTFVFYKFATFMFASFGLIFTLLLLINLNRKENEQN